MGYHLAHIKKGTFGEFSKILEETQEIQDALAQNNKIMVIVELSDLYGAIQAFAAKYGVTMKDLETMADATARAFKDGTRK